MFSATDRCGKSAYDWKTMDSFRCAGGRCVTSVPPIRTVPPETSSSPAMSRSVVDLPQPEGPSRTSILPAAASKLTSSTARVAPQ